MSSVGFTFSDSSSHACHRVARFRLVIRIRSDSPFCPIRRHCHPQAQAPGSCSHPEFLPSTSHTVFANPTSYLRAIKRIKKPARVAFASALAETMDKAVAGPLNGDVWHDLLSFVPVICSYRNVSSAWLLKRLGAGGASPKMSQVIRMLLACEVRKRQ